jgi:homoserine O-succinyltransferase
MPLVQHSNLPTFSRLRDDGHEVLSLDRAIHQDIRELHIGFLNMMPDAALQATERQFIRLVGGCNRKGEGGSGLYRPLLQPLRGPAGSGA